MLLTSIDVNPVYANMAFDWVYDNYKDDIINMDKELSKILVSPFQLIIV
ncbi:hypothetical protein SAG0305_05360 [Streptococcus agalactiae GB00020]|nr:conserved hypothetical protein [Streptococcus agalactiae CJB111]EPT77635.1 hypothetical protein SAG0070_09610 [Streptococcus agalactiae CCUG 44077]EPT96504.1 hypothetical protein SAG0108_02570 [Streptococcus agalactiae BSU92]EPT99792.1 hypothetical protein SAG0109_05285 [Streptococcus agalactiae BSU108]EPU25296.1 hypothetical protein SAG0139_00225 [Streptococcus agalactiae MRI Z1-012]EPU28216.1 hypothetical protein SAG0159_00665 [Streptococcus agalactiae MRI Z1-211]EPU30902.1 hypothetical 